MANFPTTTIARFWSKVNVRSGNDKCWEWQGSFSKNGYGCFSINGKKEGAHRVSFLLHNGDVPESGLVVRHKCDNPRCVNPFHLEQGTKKENFADFVKRQNPKFEGRCGEANGRARLNENQVAEIRIRIASGETNMKIAQSYGVDHSTISKIRTSNSWANGPKSVRSDERKSA